jgi:hypothetical protein
LGECSELLYILLPRALHNQLDPFVRALNHREERSSSDREREGWAFYAKANSALHEKTSGVLPGLKEGKTKSAPMTLVLVKAMKV